MPKSLRDKLAATNFSIPKKNSNDGVCAHHGSFNNATPIFKSPKKKAKIDAPKSKNEYDLYLAFNQVSNTQDESMLIIGSRRIYTYHRNKINDTVHPPRDKGAHIQLSTQKETEENSFTLRMEALHKVISIRDYLNVTKPASHSKARVKSGDILNIYTRDPYLHEMVAGTNPDAAEALAEFNSINQDITIHIKKPEDDNEHMQQALRTLRQHTADLHT